jgi:ankyrin repeat protein
MKISFPKLLKLISVIFCIGISVQVSAQTISDETIDSIMNSDDTVVLKKFITSNNVNNCQGNYSILSHAIRYGAKNCFDFLVKMGADVNLICNNYVPPIMHAVKYGRLDFLKVLIAKGANLNYKYSGDNPVIQDMTPLTYAEKYNQAEIVNYLRSIKKPNEP